MKKNKVFTGIMATVCAATLVVVGTLAAGNDRLTNHFFGAQATQPPTNPPSVEIRENHTIGKLGQKEIYGYNSGEDIAYIRMNLREVLLTGATAPGDTAAAGLLTLDWLTHVPDGTDYSNGADHLDHENNNLGDKFHGDFVWTFNELSDAFSGRVMSEAAYRAVTGVKPTNVWIYDVDGWAYWSEPVQPGQSTGMFLVDVKLDPSSPLAGTDYYYAIDANLEWVSNADLAMWISGAPSVNPTDTNQTKAFSASIQDHFTAKKALNTAAVQKYNVSIPKLNSLSVGAMPTLTTADVTITEKVGGATVAAATISVTPSTLVAGENEIVVTIKTATVNGPTGTTNKTGGDTITYRQTVTLGAPANPNPVITVNGTQYQLSADSGNPRVYEIKSGANAGGFVYYKGTNAATMANGATVPAADLIKVVYWPEPIYVGEIVGDETARPYYVGSKYLLEYQPGFCYVAIFPQGVNYYQAFSTGQDTSIGGMDNKYAGIMGADRVPSDQIYMMPGTPIV